jgi:hypothetical protein
MQMIIHIIEIFGSGLKIKFNPDKTNYLAINEHLKLNEHQLQNMVLKLNGLPVEKVKSIKYLGNIINLALNNTDHFNNRIRLATSAMFKLNECGYDESLDAITIVQLYKTYSRPALVYGIENLNLNIGETDWITNFEKQVIKNLLKFAPFQHTKFCSMLLNLNLWMRKSQ